MPAHDWTRVDPGIFHDFHNVWIAELRNRLNSGGLPAGYYALSEQHAGNYIVDVLTLHSGTRTEAAPPRVTSGGLAVAEHPPKVRRELSLSASARSRRKTLAIRHVSDHRLIALLEIVSAANQDRKAHLQDFLDKAEDALRYGIHLLVVDLFPPGKRDPKGIHGALWERLGDEAEDIPKAEPLTASAYVADTPVRAYLESFAVGEQVPEMPLFLNPENYINAPLEETYEIAWRGTPEHWRGVLERPLTRRKRR